MNISSYFPIWNQLTPDEQLLLSKNTTKRSVSAGTLLHNGASDCVGLLAVCSGQLRAYISSEEGKEITIYRLFERDICLFSASCMMQSIRFDISISAEKDTELMIISADVYKQVMTRSAALANFTNQIMASRFSEVMWLIEQIMWKSMDKRLASFLLEEKVLEDSPILKITHEKIAAHMGTAREVITRMLRYLQSEHMVRLSRGTVEITDVMSLQKLSDS
jgi:CRP/FNR family transcriptional regulator